MQVKQITPKDVWKIFNRNFAQSAEYCEDEFRNAAFIRTTVQYLKRLCSVNGWITLNDIWDVLGFSRTNEGMVYGFTFKDEIDIDYRRGYITVKNCRIIHNKIGA